MVRTVEIPADQIEVKGDRIEIHADFGGGQIVGVSFRIQDSGVPIVDPTKKTLEEWERELDEIIKLAPLNQYPVDDSREAIYGPDPDEDDPN